MTEFEKELVRFVSGYLDAGVSAEDYVKAFSQRLLDSIGRQSKEQPVDLEKEIKETFDKDITTLKSFGAYSRFARHFYELGRQSKEQPLCEDFDLESDRFFRKLPLRANTPPIPDEYIDEETFDKIARHFAQWQKEQLMKEAVEGDVFQSHFFKDSHIFVQSDYLPIGQFKEGDKVKLIIVKEGTK